MKLSNRELFENKISEGMPVDAREALFRRNESGYKLAQVQQNYKWFCEGVKAYVAISEVEQLRKELAEYKNPKNWTRPYKYNGELANEHALYRPRIKWD